MPLIFLKFTILSYFHSYDTSWCFKNDFQSCYKILCFYHLHAYLLMLTVINLWCFSMTPSTIIRSEMVTLLENFGFKHPQRWILMLLILLELLVRLYYFAFHLLTDGTLSFMNAEIIIYYMHFLCRFFSGSK